MSLIEYIGVSLIEYIGVSLIEYIGVSLIEYIGVRLIEYIGVRLNIYVWDKSELSFPSLASHYVWCLFSSLLGRSAGAVEV